MATGTVMPSPWFTGLDDSGHPLVGGKLYTFAAGTSVNLATYSDVGLTTPNANPVVLDAAGRATVFLSAASYKFVLKDANGVTIRTQDNVSAVAPFAVNLDIDGVAGEALTAGDVAYLSDGSGGKTAGRWYKADADFDYASSLPQIAMVPNDIASSASGSFRLQGRMTLAGPLTPGATYYISNTAGALSSSAGTNTRKVGVADSATSLVMTSTTSSSGPTSASNILANQSFS